MGVEITTHTAANVAEAFFFWKEDLKTNGWTVGSSSDGTTYNASGDQITSGGSGAGGFNNDSAWVRLVAPDGTREILLQRTGDADSANVVFSFGSNAFTGGSPDATTRPFATSEVGVVGPTFGTALPGGPYSQTIGIDALSPYSTYMAFDTAGVPFMGLALDCIVAMGDPAVFHLLDPVGFIFEFGPIYTTPYAWDTIVGRLDAAGGGPTDTTAPTISAFTPTTGSSITRTASIAADVADETALRTVVIWGVLADGTELLVYDGSAFVGIFATSSTISTGTYTVIPDAPGWPSSTVAVHIRAIDTSGNQTDATGSFTITNAPAAPTVGPFSPTDGGNTTRTGTVTIDVTDDEGRTALTLVSIDVTLSDGKVVSAYNGAAFPGPLAASSARSNITDGYRYTLIHDGAGWPSSTLAYRVEAVDAQGRRTTSTSYNLVVTDAPAAPVIGSWTPSAGAVARADNVDLTVASPDGFSKIVVWAVLGDGSTVVVYDGAAFSSLVNAASTVSGTTTKSFSITYDGAGWVDDYTLNVLAIDSAGRSSTATQAYTLSDPPDPVVVDTTPPQISALTPADTSDLARNQAVRFNVTDDILLRRVFVFVNMGTTDEVIWNGYAFTAKYAGGSTITETEGGFAFVVLRSGGWVSGPTFTIHPFDTSGNEA